MQSQLNYYSSFCHGLWSEKRGLMFYHILSCVILTKNINIISKISVLIPVLHKFTKWNGNKLAKLKKEFGITKNINNCQKLPVIIPVLCT